MAHSDVSILLLTCNGPLLYKSEHFLNFSVLISNVLSIDKYDPHESYLGSSNFKC